jgi:hypothetical protein
MVCPLESIRSCRIAMFGRTRYWTYALKLVNLPENFAITYVLSAADPLNLPMDNVDQM